MNLASWCVKNNRTAAVLFVLVVLLGVATFRDIGRLENPDFTIRSAQIVTSFPGASPLRVEQLVTDRLEEELRTIPEIETVHSQSLTGLSLITVDVHERYRDMEPIWSRLRNRIEDARARLPDGVRDPVVNDEFGDVFGVVVALTSDGYTYREIKDAADRTRDELQKLDLVAKVDLHGTQDERVFVEFSDARLAEYGLSPYLIARMLEAQNAVQPGGSAVVGGENIGIEATGEFRSLQDIRRASIRLPGGAQTIYLEDVAAIERGFIDPPGTMARCNGERCLVLALSMVEGGNIIDMGEQVQDALRRVEATLPVGLDFETLVFQPRFVERSIRDFMSNLYQAVFFVVVVMLCFAGLRMGVIAGALIPMTMLATIALMPVFDIKLQNISIASLIIALGMLVDNGVVVSENILVRLQRGEDRMRAIGEAVRELKLPLLAASGTTICAFLPIATARSSTGEYCFSLFVVVSLALVCSWVFSLSLVPLLCYFGLRPKQTGKQSFDGRFYRTYRRALVTCLRHRGRALAGLGAAFMLSLWLFQFVPKLFFPPNEREMFYIDVWQPYGTDIRETAQRLEPLEAFLLAQKEVESVGAFVGSGGPRWYLSLAVEGNNPNYAFVLVNTETISGARAVIDRVRDWLRVEMPDARVRVNQLENGPPVGYPIQLRIGGDDLGTLYALRDRLTERLAAMPGVQGVHDNWGEWTKKLTVDVNQEAAKRAGLTSEDIALSLKTQMSGLRATEYREGSDIIPIVLRSNEAYREDLGRIETLNVYSFFTGDSLPLLTVARADLVWQPSLIRRRDQTRTMTVQAEVLGRYASEVVNELRPELAAWRAAPDWPAGYDIVVGGEFEDSSAAQASIAAGFPMAFGLLALILVAQFNSLRRPAIIVLTIPPMMIGISVGMLLTQAPFGFMAMLGMISLMGIIVNNAIMMIDRIEIERAEGGPPAQALVRAAQQRLRPILMTACTTMVGLVPLSLNGGEFWRPMANCIIFGLGFATVLTLVLCPVLYSLFFRIDCRGLTVATADT